MKITITNDEGEIRQEVDEVKIMCAVLLSPKIGRGFLITSDALEKGLHNHVTNSFMTIALKEVIKQSVDLCTQDTKSLENDMKLELLRKFTDELDSLMSMITIMREKENSNVSH